MRALLVVAWRSIAVVWASPWSLLGLTVGCLALLTGGGMQWKGRVIEFYGGFASWVLGRMPNGQFVLAMTLGHTILGKSQATLHVAREHEMVHVRQYERWGLFFIPAYLVASALLWLLGRDAYRDNPFERQAYDEVG